MRATSIIQIRKSDIENKKCRPHGGLLQYFQSKVTLSRVRIDLNPFGRVYVQWLWEEQSRWLYGR